MHPKKVKSRAKNLALVNAPFKKILERTTMKAGYVYKRMVAVAMVVNLMA
jgi:hypothetical protein